VSFRLPAGAVVADLPRVGEDLRIAGSVVDVRTRSATADVAALAGWAVQRGVELEGLSLTRPSLEDVYLDLVGGQDGPGVGTTEEGSSDGTPEVAAEGAR
jgi:ABC-2 type transport system ATP-binding protein